jgi:RNA polymerase sigma-70 factor, ECF subfamily
MNTQDQQPFASDTDLMNRIAQRDQGAMAELYQHYGHLVYGLAFRILQTRELAEEITQDTFLTVWNHPERWSPARGMLSSWLLTVSRYKAIDRIRREQRRPDMQASPLNEELVYSEALPQPDDTRFEEGRLIRTFLSQLPPEQRQVIELAFFQGMTHTTMAQLLNIPLGTVKTRLRLGLQKLRMLWEASIQSDN